MVEVTILLKPCLCRWRLNIFKESKFGNQIVISLISFWTNAIATVRVSVVFHGKFWKNAGVQLVGAVIGTSEGCNLYRVSHPSFPEYWNGSSNLLLDWLDPVRSKCTASRVENCLETLQFLDFVSLCSVTVVVAVLGLDTFDLILTESCSIKK